MKKMCVFILMLFCLFIGEAIAAGLMLFTNEVDAQKHCPKDIVVWLNLPTGVWHYKGARWYGNTKHGSYVCKGEAQGAGDRASLNGS